MGEKLDVNLPTVRVSERLYIDLARLADADDRKFSDYVRWVLALHCYGHARTLQASADQCNQNRASQCDSPMRAKRVHGGTDGNEG